MAKSNVKSANGLKDARCSNRATCAFAGSLIVGTGSPSISSSTTTSPPSSMISSPLSSRAGTPPSVALHSIADVERCSCCTIGDFQKIYESFRLMDKRGCGSVRRCDFYEASTEHVTLEMQRTISRGELHQRFRSSAAEMTLVELLERIWPTATDKDHRMMSSWTKLSDAFSVLSAASFQGTREDFKQIFDLLDLDGSQTLSMSELVQAHIFSKAECQRLLKDWYKAVSKHEFGRDSGCESGEKKSLSLSFDQFCNLTQKDLDEKYAHKEDPCYSNCRLAFRASKATNAAREGCDLLPDKTSRSSPQKVSLKTAAIGVLAAKVAFGFAERSPPNQGSTMMTS